MKIKKVCAVCSEDGHYYLMDQRNKAGDVLCQWLGDGKSAYPLAGLPYMDVENICAMFDITEKRREKLVMRQMDAPETMSWDDADPTERRIPDPKLCVRYGGWDLLPLETSEGVTFIQEKYLAPLESSEYMQLYERKSAGGGLYIAAKDGMVLQAVIMPMDFPNLDFIDLLDDLTGRCRAALLGKSRMQAERDREQSTLFHADKSAREMIGEGAEMV